MNNLPSRKTTLSLSLLGALSVCTLFLVAIAATAQPSIKNPISPGTVSLDPKYLTAKAAVLYDPHTGRVLYGKDPDAQLPLASLTKLMAAAAVLKSTSAGDPLVSITAHDLEPDGDWNFRVGDEWRLSQLLIFGLVASSNDAMAAAAAAAGDDVIAAMNKTAGMLGLTHTYFLNPTGLDETSELSGAYGSARDVAVLTSTFLREYPELFEATAQPRVSISSAAGRLTATSTATPLLSIPGFIGAKTGYTDLAGGNLVAAFDFEVGHPLIAVVLGSTREGRFQDIRTLIRAARTQL